MNRQLGEMLMSEKLFLSFCLAFDFVSGEMTSSEHEFWNLTLDTEKKVRQFYLKGKSQYQSKGVYFTNLSDGLSKVIRPVQTNYGVALCGEILQITR